MVGENFGSVAQRVGGVSLDRGRDLRVQLLTPGLQERLIRGVLNQGVLEDVGRLRRRAATEDQLGYNELFEGIG